MCGGHIITHVSVPAQSFRRVRAGLVTPCHAAPGHSVQPDGSPVAGRVPVGDLLGQLEGAAEGAVGEGEGDALGTEAGLVCGGNLHIEGFRRKAAELRELLPPLFFLSRTSCGIGGGT